MPLNSEKKAPILSDPDRGRYVAIPPGVIKLGTVNPQESLTAMSVGGKAVLAGILPFSISSCSHASGICNGSGSVSPKGRATTGGGQPILRDGDTGQCIGQCTTPAGLQVPMLCQIRLQARKASTVAAAGAGREAGKSVPAASKVDPSPREGQCHVHLLGPDGLALGDFRCLIGVEEMPKTPVSDRGAQVPLNSAIKVAFEKHDEILDVSETLLEVSVSAFEAAFGASAKVLRNEGEFLRRYSQRVETWADILRKAQPQQAEPVFRAMRKTIAGATKIASIRAEKMERLLAPVVDNLDYSMRWIKVENLQKLSMPEEVARLRRLLTETVPTALEDAKRLALEAEKSIVSSLQKGKWHSWLGKTSKYLNWLSLGMAVANVALAKEKGREFIRQAANVGVSAGGGYAAGLTASTLCGPAAPLCAFTVVAGASIAVAFAADWSEENVPEPFEEFCQKTWEDLNKQFFEPADRVRVLHKLEL